MLTLLQIAKLQRDAINHVNACSACSSHSLGFGIVVERKLFADRVAGTDVSRVIQHAKNEPSQPGRRSRYLLGMQNTLCAFNEGFQADASDGKADVLLDLCK